MGRQVAHVIQALILRFRICPLDATLELHSNVARKTTPDFADVQILCRSDESLSAERRPPPGRRITKVQVAAANSRPQGSHE